MATGAASRVLVIWLVSVDVTQYAALVQEVLNIVHLLRCQLS
jgi:hypothetical protein